MNPMVCDAIKRRCLIQFEYNSLARTVEPYAHGFNAARKEVVRGFQVAGESRSDEALGWRFFIVADMSNLTVLPQNFRGVREGRATVTKELIVIHCVAG